MPLKEYVAQNRKQRFDDGGEVDGVEAQVSEPTPTVPRETSQKKHTASPLAAFAGDPKTAAERDARMREFYNKQLADAKAQEGSFGELTGIDAVLRKYGSLDSSGNRVEEKGLQDAYAAREKAKATATAGLADLDTQQASLNTRKAVIDAIKAGDLNLAATIDPTLTKDIIGAKYSQQKAEADITKTLADASKASGANTAALSPQGKQAADEGFKPGTPEFNARVTALVKGEAKPLTEGDKNRIADYNKARDTASASMSDGAQILSILDQGAHVARFNPIAMIQRTFGFGSGAQVETLISGMAPKQRPPGSGATSDYDAKQYKVAVGGGLTAADLRKRVEAGLAVSASDKQWYAALTKAVENKIPTSRVTEAWDKYKDEVPIFDKKTGKPIENRKPFEQWLQEKGINLWEGGTVQAAPAVKPATENKQKDAVLPPEIVSQLKEGYKTPVTNPQGQQEWWTLQNGQPVRLPA